MQQVYRILKSLTLMPRLFSACNFHPRTELFLALIRSFARAQPGDADFQCPVLSQFSRAIKTTYAEINQTINQSSKGVQCGLFIYRYILIAGYESYLTHIHKVGGRKR
jgi:hypothetical protein